MEHVRTPRCYWQATLLDLGTEIQVHILVDASEKGMAAAAVPFRFEEAGETEH